MNCELNSLKMEAATRKQMLRQMLRHLVKQMLRQMSHQLANQNEEPITKNQ